MTLLIGSETTPTQSEGTIPQGKIYTCRFTAVAQGTVEAIGIKVGTNQISTELWLGIYADAAGFPGALLEQRKTPQIGAKERLVELAGFSVTVGAGTAYWLAAIALKVLAFPLRPISNAGPGEANERQSVASMAGGLVELSETQWSGLAFSGAPEIFFGTGTLAPPHSAGLVEARQKGGNA